MPLHSFDDPVNANILFSQPHMDLQKDPSVSMPSLHSISKTGWREQDRMSEERIYKAMVY